MGVVVIITKIGAKDSLNKNISTQQYIKKKPMMYWTKYTDGYVIIFLKLIFVLKTKIVLNIYEVKIPVQKESVYDIL